jgi:hypothetical protein
MPAKPQLTFKGHVVDVLEKPEPERVIDLEERTDDGARELLFDKDVAFHERKIVSYPPSSTTKSLHA